MTDFVIFCNTWGWNLPNVAGHISSTTWTTADAWKEPILGKRGIISLAYAAHVGEWAVQLQIQHLRLFQTNQLLYDKIWQVYFCVKAFEPGITQHFLASTSLGANVCQHVPTKAALHWSTWQQFAFGRSITTSSGQCPSGLVKIRTVEMFALALLVSIEWQG